MDTITTKCSNCTQKFQAPAKERKRGNAKYCSRSCSAKAGNRRRALRQYKCMRCGDAFESKAYRAKYCSTTCRVATNVKSSNMPKRRNHLAARVRKDFGVLACFACNWDKALCDVHHVVPRRNGGTNTYDNLSIICPNCHRLAHLGLLDVTKLPTLSSRDRTMSSPAT